MRKIAWLMRHGKGHFPIVFKEVSFLFLWFPVSLKKSYHLDNLNPSNACFKSPAVSTIFSGSSPLDIR